MEGNENKKDIWKWKYPAFVPAEVQGSLSTIALDFRWNESGVFPFLDVFLVFVSSNSHLLFYFT
jgi:hypothetical protein